MSTVPRAPDSPSRAHTEANRAGPATLVLLSEILRLLTGPALSSATHRLRAGRRALTTRSEQ